MRKELTVFVNTLEQGEEISVSSVAKNRKFVIITSATGMKITASLEELKQSLEELVKFNNSESISNIGSEGMKTEESSYLDFEYVKTDS